MGSCWDLVCDNSMLGRGLCSVLLLNSARSGVLWSRVSVFAACAMNAFLAIRVEALAPSGRMNSSDEPVRKPWMLVSEGRLSKSDGCFCKGLRYGEPSVLVNLKMPDFDVTGVLLFDVVCGIMLTLRFDNTFRGDRDRAKVELSGDFEKASFDARGEFVGRENRSKDCRHDCTRSVE